jgi:hypothetical protein
MDSPTQRTSIAKLAPDRPARCIRTRPPRTRKARSRRTPRPMRRAPSRWQTNRGTPGAVRWGTPRSEGEQRPASRGCRRRMQSCCTTAGGRSRTRSRRQSDRGFPPPAEPAGTRGWVHRSRPRGGRPSRKAERRRSRRPSRRRRAPEPRRRPARTRSTACSRTRRARSSPVRSPGWQGTRDARRGSRYHAPAHWLVLATVMSCDSKELKMQGLFAQALLNVSTSSYPAPRCHPFGSRLGDTTVERRARVSSCVGAVAPTAP